MNVVVLGPPLGIREGATRAQATLIGPAAGLCPEAGQEVRTGPLTSASVLVLPCPSRISGAGVTSSASAPVAEVVQSGFLPLRRTIAATAPAAVASIAMPASLRRL